MEPSHAEARANNIPGGGSTKMRISSIYSATRTLSVALAATLVVATLSHAQMGGSRQPAAPTASGADSMQTELHELTDVQTQKIQGDPQQEAAYKAFFKADEPAKKIQLGSSFLQKYPKSPLDEPVDVGLMNVYYAKQDWKNFYSYADSALALKPDDVDVLATVGWVIPHFYDPNDSDADSQLDKAEKLEKHAIEIIPAMPKPSNLSDAQFAALKTQKTVQAHSALGLVYFRREDYDNSVKELQQSTKNNPSPDQTDLFVLGVDLQSLMRYSEAVDAFNQCAQIAGGMQDRCKQSADAAKKLAAAPKN
jgi:tetratricopeptide (TPR) repeat protein